MSLTIANIERTVFGNKSVAYADITFDSSYPRGGEAFTPSTVGFSQITSIEVPNSEGGVFPAFDAVNNKIKLLARRSPSGKTLTCSDDNAAASHGVGIYVHVPTATVDFARENGAGQPVVGWLEFVSPTNANSSLALSNGDTIPLYDDDAAATGGIAVYNDEDEAVVSPLQANIATLLQSVLVRTNGGNYALISHDASAAANGVLVYHDEDGATELEFVSPTNATSVVSVDPEITPAAVLTGFTFRARIFGY